MNRTHLIRVAFAVIALGFFVTPVALRAVGVTAEAFENRPFATAPKLSQGWDAFQQTTAFLIDRMPLRAQAVRANTRIWTDVFGTAPRYGQDPLGADQALPFAGNAEEGAAPGQPTAAQNAQQVLPGEDGWLYLQNEQDVACNPPLDPSKALERWSALVRTVRSSGRHAVLIVPADKATIYPEYLPGDFEVKDCAARGKREMWSVLDGAPASSGVIGLREALLAEKRRRTGEIYMSKDSHWNTIGALVGVRQVLTSIGRDVRVRASELVRLPPTKYTGDLTNLIGNPEETTTPTLGVKRAPDAPRVPGRTVFVGDSFGQTPFAQLQPYFEQLRWAPWVGTPPAKLIREIQLADTVIFETVEREFAPRASDPGIVPPLNAELVARLRSR